MAPDHPQGGCAAFELEHHTCISSGTKLEVAALQTPNAKSGMQVRFAESVAQKINGLGDLSLSLSWQVSRLRPETRGELNP